MDDPYVDKMKRLEQTILSGTGELASSVRQASVLNASMKTKGACVMRARRTMGVVKRWSCRWSIHCEPGYVVIQASPRRLLDLECGHWSIENRLHDVRDVSFGEDRSRLRSGSAPQTMAALCNLAITLIHRSGSSQIAASRRHFASHPREAFSLLLQKTTLTQQSSTDLESTSLHSCGQARLPR